MHGKSDVANRNARQAIKEQIRSAETTQSEPHDEDRSRIQKYIREVVETTRCSQSQAEIALHDAGNNVEAAVNQLLESVNPETWTHAKRKGPKAKEAQNEQEDGFKKGGVRPVRRGPLNANPKTGGGNFPPRDGFRGGDQRDARKVRQPRPKEGGNGFRPRDQNARPPRREFNGKRDNAWETAKPAVDNEEDGDDLWGTGKSLVFSRRENVDESVSQQQQPAEIAAVPALVEQQPKNSAPSKPCAAGPLSFADVVRKNAQKATPPQPVKVTAVPRTGVSQENSQATDSQLKASPAPVDDKHQSNVRLEAEHRDEKAPSPLSSHVPSVEDQMQKSLTDKLKNDLGLAASTVPAAFSTAKTLQELTFSKQSALNAGIVEFVSGELPGVSADFHFGFNAGPSIAQQHSLMDDRFQMQNEALVKASEPSRPESAVLNAVAQESAAPPTNAAAVMNQYVQAQQHASQPPQHLSYSHHQQQQSNQYKRSRNGANNSSSTFNDNYPVNFQTEARNTYGAPPSPPKSQNIPQGLQAQQSSQQMAQSQAQQPPHHPQHMYQPTQLPYNFPYMYSPVPQPGMREEFTSILPYQFNLNQMDLNPLTMTQLAVTSAGPIPGHQQHHQNSHQQQNLGQHSQNSHSAQSHQRDSTWLNSQVPPASQNSQPNGHGSQSNANLNSSQQRQSMVDNNSQNMLGGNAIQPPPGFAPNMAAAPFRAPVFTAYHAPPPYLQFPYVIPQTHNKSKP